MTEQEMKDEIRRIAADFEAHAMEFVGSGDVGIPHAEKYFGPLLDRYQVELKRMARLRRETITAEQAAEGLDSASGDKQE